MTRRSNRLALGSASAAAITAMLTACSQPASYATVDLSGSYTQQPVNAYSALTGEPVYGTATALYGPQSYPDYVPNSQLAYAEDAPANQVAALNYGAPTLGGGYSPIPTYQSEAQYSAPVVTDAPLVAAPQFQTELSEVAPLAQYDSIGSLDAQTVPQAVTPADPYAPIESIDTAYSVPVFEDAYAPAPVRSAPPQGITEAPLPEITAAPLPELSAPSQPDINPLSDAELTADPMSLSVGDDYVTWDQLPPTAAPAPAPSPVYEPDTAFTREAMDLLPPRAQETRLPSPNAVPPQTLENTGRVPKASGAYPRPYELLRPGIYPDIGAGEGLVEAPAVTPMPRVAFVRNDGEAAPEQPLDRAASREGDYMIRFGDTLTKIADRVGVSLDTLLAENDLDANATIYAGQRIALPIAEIEVGLPMIEVAETLEDAPSDFDAAPLPSITADEIREALERSEPVQRASVPTKQAKETPAERPFAWPVHGEVYALGAGQIEIDPDGFAPVSATAAGDVVHVERGPLGVLVVIEHDNGWRSLLVGLKLAHVHVGDRLAAGARIGTAAPDHRVRFELRDAENGMANVLEQLRG